MPGKLGPKFRILMNLGIAFFLSLVMTIAGQTLSGSLSPEMFLKGFILGIAVGYTIADAVPFPQWAEAITRNVKNNALNYVLKNAVAAVFASILIGGVVNFVVLGFGFWRVLIFSFPVMYLVVFVALLIFPPIVLKAVKALDA